MSAETWIPWNDGATPRTCHCETCDAPAELPCRICDRDGIEMREQGLCEACAQGLDLVEEESK